MKKTKVFIGSYAQHTGLDGAAEKAQSLIDQAESQGLEIHSLTLGAHGEIVLLANSDSLAPGIIQPLTGSGSADTGTTSESGSDPLKTGGPETGADKARTSEVKKEGFGAKVKNALNIK